MVLIFYCNFFKFRPNSIKLGVVEHFIKVYAAIHKNLWYLISETTQGKYLFQHSSYFISFPGENDSTCCTNVERIARFYKMKQIKYFAPNLTRKGLSYKICTVFILKIPNCKNVKILKNGFSELFIFLDGSFADPQR